MRQPFCLYCTLFWLLWWLLAASVAADMSPTNQADNATLCDSHVPKQDVMEQKVEELVTNILYHRKLYESGQPPQISDTAYDLLVVSLENIVSCFPRYQTALAQVRAPLVPVKSSADEVTHMRPMLSLQKAYQRSQVEGFVSRFDGEEFILQPKFDGIAVELQYVGGSLEVASTRGDGMHGSDITGLLRNLADVPEQIAFSKPLAVYGELVASKQCYQQFAADYVSARHMAAALVARQTWPDQQLTCLGFYPYELFPYASHQPVLAAGIADSDQPLQTLTLLASWGFRDISAHSHITASADEIYRLFQRYANLSELDVDLDGIVIKLADHEKRDLLGSSSYAPHWAMAWKYSQPVAISRVRQVDWRQGRTGKWTPVLLIEPVTISGHQIQRVSGRSADWLIKHGAGEGAMVEVTLKGAAVPQITAVVNTSAKLTMPDAVKSTTAEPILCLTYGEQCLQRYPLQLVHTLKSLGIEGFGLAKVNQMLDNEQLSSLDKIFSHPGLLKQTRLALPLSSKQLLEMLGVPGLRKRVLLELAQTYPDPELLIVQDAPSLQAIDGLGKVTSSRLVKVLAYPAVRRLVALNG